MYDALTIAAIVDDLTRLLVGGRIQQIVHLDPLSLALEVYAQHQRRWLILSADQQHARVLLAEDRVTGDAERVSPVLLLLRKYARGGRIVAVSQPRYERIIRLSIAKPIWPDKTDDEPPSGEDDDAPGGLVYSELIVELMGRRSNVIFVDEHGRIRDAVKRVTAQMSRARTVLPGQPYAPPPPQEKLEPLGVSAQTVWQEARQSKTTVERFLVERFVAVSPLLAREVVARAACQPDAPAGMLEHDDAARIADALNEVFGVLASGAWGPGVYVFDGNGAEFAPIELRSLAAQPTVTYTPCRSTLEAAALALAHGSTVAVAGDRHAARRERLVAEIDDLRDKVAHRVASLAEQQEQAEAAELWRRMGEAIYAAISALRPGMTELRADDGLVVPLDPTLSASDNAQRYFERYRKARSAEENLPALIEQAQLELAYLDQLLSLARLAETYDEIEAVRLEWLDYTASSGQTSRASRPKGARPAQAARRPRTYRTARGDTIFVGRTGPQNEAVTFDLAGPHDLWLHARNMPGAHVILRPVGEPDDDTIGLAAALAAYYSDGRDATTVPVDVTERRHVRKIKGGGPGMVTYRNERTLNVRPRSEADLGLSSQR